MPYLEPAQVLREFSRYALTEIRPAIADDEEFMRGQVGSMASTLRFLAAELEGMDDAVATQRTSLLDALEAARAVVDDPEVEARLDELRGNVDAAEGETRAVEAAIVGAADGALAAIDELDPETAREARAPLYEFLEDRLSAQLGLLGRPPADG